MVCKDEYSYPKDASPAELRQRIAELEAEVFEQCRLNGMGSEREAKLMGQVEALERCNAELLAGTQSDINALRHQGESLVKAYQQIDYLADRVQRLVKMLVERRPGASGAAVPYPPHPG